MPKFIIAVREVWVQSSEVEADNLKEALDKVSKGNCTPVPYAFEYSHTLDRSTWTSEQVEEKPK